MFVNRDAELARLRCALADGRSPGVPSLVVVIGGPGVGKSATARHWAHANTERFVDGQLYVDLSVRNKGLVSISSTLASLLRSLGVDESVIPDALADRTSLFRSRLAGKRVLILVEDARYAAEVTPLLPAESDCCLLVTSRSSLQELVAEGASVVRLGPLELSASEQMLLDMCGTPSDTSERAAITSVARSCGGLPIALRICGALATSRGSASWLAARLLDESARLSRMKVGAAASVQAVFDEAYTELASDEASLYRILGVQPCVVFGRGLVEALVPGSESTLDRLIDSQLIEDWGGRLRFHDLVRTHARQVAESLDAEAQREAIITSTIEYYVSQAQHMDRAIVPERLRFAEAPSRDSEFADAAAALRWFELERANLLAALRAASERELHHCRWRLAEAMWIAYNNHRHPEEALDVYATGVAGAHAHGDPGVEARMRQQLARAAIDLGDFDTAAGELDEAARLAERVDLPRLSASILEFRGVLEIERKRFSAAIDPLLRARELFARHGFRRGVALQDYLLGRAYTGLTDYARAIARLHEAAAAIDADSDPVTHGRVLLRLGEAEGAAGKLDAAAEHLGACIAVMRRADALIYVASALEGLGGVRGAQGAADLERRELEAAHALYLRVGSPRAETVRERLTALNG
jgi:tetratricopeptide (TPR) repeat protein